MQLSYFTNGGYVIHKAMIAGRKFSVWFDDDGNLKDAEKFDSRGRSIKPTASDLKSLQNSFGGRQNFAWWNQPFCINKKDY